MNPSAPEACHMPKRQPFDDLEMNAPTTKIAPPPYDQDYEEPPPPSYFEATRGGIVKAIKGGGATYPLVGEKIKANVSRTIPVINTLAYKASGLVGITIGIIILSLFACLPSGACNILHNLVGSKVMAVKHQGYDFHGGRNVLGYLVSGMVMALPAAALRVFFALNGEGAASTYRFLNIYVMPVAWAAIEGALGAAINHYVGYETISPRHAAIAGAVSAAIFISWCGLALCCFGRRRP
jgi:hypothetical protein